jgi:thymidylate synthase
MADKLGFERGEFIWTLGDVHLYKNHVEQAKEQLDRDTFKAPTLAKMEPGDPLKVEFNEIKLLGYNSQPTIKAPIAV